VIELSADDRERLEEIAVVLADSNDSRLRRTDAAFLHRLASVSPEVPGEEGDEPLDITELHTDSVIGSVPLLRALAEKADDLQAREDEAIAAMEVWKYRATAAEALIEQAAQEFERRAVEAQRNADMEWRGETERAMIATAAETYRRAAQHLRGKQAAHSEGVGSGAGTRGDGHGGSVEHNAEVSPSTSAPPASAAPSAPAPSPEVEQGERRCGGTGLIPQADGNENCPGCADCQPSPQREGDGR
jgi:hypothetical protein